MHTTMPTIKELAIPLDQCPYVNSESSIHNAAALLLPHTMNGSGKHPFDELLVINDKNEYVGRLTIRSILVCYFPSLFDGDQKEIFAGKKEKFTDLAILIEDSFQSECKRQGALPVSRFMSSPLKSIKSNLHPLHAAEIMMETQENCLPVLENETLIGVIRLTDLFRALAGVCAL